MASFAHRARSKQLGRRTHRGAVLVELALTFSILSVVLFGIVEMAFLYHDEAAVSNAAREACRYAADGHSVLLSESRGASAAPNISGLEPHVYCSTDNGATYTEISGAATASTGSMIKVTEKYTHNYLTGFMTSRSADIKVAVFMRRIM